MQDFQIKIVNQTKYLSPFITSILSFVWVKVLDCKMTAIVLFCLSLSCLLSYLLFDSLIYLSQTIAMAANFSN